MTYDWRAEYEKQHGKLPDCLAPSPSERQPRSRKARPATQPPLAARERANPEPAVTGHPDGQAGEGSASPADLPKPISPPREAPEPPADPKTGGQPVARSGAKDASISPSGRPVRGRRAGTAKTDRRAGAPVDDEVVGRARAQRDDFATGQDLTGRPVDPAYERNGYRVRANANHMRCKVMGQAERDVLAARLRRRGHDLSDAYVRQTDGALMVRQAQGQGFVNAAWVVGK